MNRKTLSLVIGLVCSTSVATAESPSDAELLQEVTRARPSPVYHRYGASSAGGTQLRRYLELMC